MMLGKGKANNKIRCFMKKMIVMLTIFFAIGTVTNEAVAQPPHAKAWGKKSKQQWKRGHYYYYPSVNVYYSPVVRRYWYPRNGIWMNTGMLPPSVVVYNQPHYVVYRDMDDDIWRDNRRHARSYRPVYMERRRPVRSGVSVNIQASF